MAGVPVEEPDPAVVPAPVALRHVGDVQGGQAVVRVGQLVCGGGGGGGDAVELRQLSRRWSASKN